MIQQIRFAIISVKCRNNKTYSLMKPTSHNAWLYESSASERFCCFGISKQHSFLKFDLSYFHFKCKIFSK